MFKVEYVPDYRRNRNGMRNYCRIVFAHSDRTGILFCECHEVEYYTRKYSS